MVSVKTFPQGTSLLLKGLISALLTSALLNNMAFALESEQMPLAERSLLLDGQVVGDRLVVVGERGHILTSEDQGHSWVQQPVPTRATLTSLFFIDPAKGWAGGHDAVILRTIDGGRHWEKVYSNPDDGRPILDLWFRDSRHGYAIGGYGLFLVTQDAGENWTTHEITPATLVLQDAPAEEPWVIGPEEQEHWGIDYHYNQITATETGRLFIAAEAGNLYRSDDGCRTWIRLPSPYEGSFYGSLPLNNHSLLLFGLRGHLFRSEDAGIHWREIPTGTQATLNDGIRLSDGRIVLVGLAGVVLISNDDGQTFQRFAQPDRLDFAKVLELPNNSLLLIGEQGTNVMLLPDRDQTEER